MENWQDALIVQSRGALIGEKHTERDWGLMWLDITITAPEAQTNIVPVPGSDESLDFTEALTGDVHFKRRRLSLVFHRAERSLEEWHVLTSQILNYCQGQKLRITLDSDPLYFYIGRISCTPVKTASFRSTYTITADIEPWKYEMADSLAGDWLWDPFRFATDVARAYGSLTVSGTLSFTITGLRKNTILRVNASAAMSVTHNGVTHPLVKGDNILPDIVIREGANLLVFTGNGTISISYRGGTF